MSMVSEALSIPAMQCMNRKKRTGVSQRIGDVFVYLRGVTE